MEMLGEPPDVNSTDNQPAILGSTGSVDGGPTPDIPRKQKTMPDIPNKQENLMQTDRQTDILLTEIKVITDLFVIVIMVMREIYVGPLHVYTRMSIC